jgi:predicted Rossmann fold flavoprotein
MESVDLAIIGAGAAGFMAAIAAGRRNPRLRVALFDGARRPGAKILVSGGSRCNVTNAHVTEADYHGGSRPQVRRVLKAFGVGETVRFFHAAGVALHEEAHGKLFPDSNRSRDVLAALVAQAAAAGVSLRPDHRVLEVSRGAGRFAIETSQGRFDAAAIVLATGGLALPRSGSDGAGYVMARRLGHTIVDTTPALVPLVLDGGATDGPPFWVEVSGVASPAAARVLHGESRLADAAGSLLWTHFGISGPCALDVSRHWLRARLEGDAPVLAITLAPGETFETLDAFALEAARRQPRASVQTLLSRRLPASLAALCLRSTGTDAGTPLAAWTRSARRALIHRLLDWRLPVSDSRGYTYAEVTAGGVSLSEVDVRTMASRVCPGAYLVGEILDVDGRLGGFNFQWAWASGFVAGSAAAERLRPDAA